MVSVIDSITGKTFIFNTHEDKEKFFDTWDQLVVRVENPRITKCVLCEKEDIHEYQGEDDDPIEGDITTTSFGNLCWDCYKKHYGC